MPAEKGRLAHKQLERSRNHGRRKCARAKWDICEKRSAEGGSEAAAMPRPAAGRVGRHEHDGMQGSVAALGCAHSARII